jgi:hypothetical protein
MRLGDVVDEFLDENGLAHAGTAEQADLAAFGVGASRSTTLMPVTRISASVDWSKNSGAGAWIGRFSHRRNHRAGIVDRLADHVHDAAERCRHRPER